MNFLDAYVQSSRGNDFLLLAARPVCRFSGIFSLHGSAHKNRQENQIDFSACFASSKATVYMMLNACALAHAIYSVYLFCLRNNGSVF